MVLFYHSIDNVEPFFWWLDLTSACTYLFRLVFSDPLSTLINVTTNIFCSESYILFQGWYDTSGDIILFLNYPSGISSPIDPYIKKDLTWQRVSNLYYLSVWKIEYNLLQNCGLTNPLFLFMTKCIQDIRPL